jgi:DNA-binding CsgD family transcriptional regulator
MELFISLVTILFENSKQHFCSIKRERKAYDIGIGVWYSWKGMSMKTRRKHLKRQIRSPSAAQTSSTSEASSTNIVNHVQYFLHLLNIGQQLRGQTSGVGERLCEEVGLVTQGGAQLVLQYRGLAQRAQIPSPSQAVSFPVQFGDLNYGTFYVAFDPAQPAHPLIPAKVADSLAQLCGILLYTFEVSALLQAQYQHLEHPVYESLTKRQREVLTLLCHGYEREEIAKALSIAPATVNTHRQHIYERLGIHNERDVLLAAYQAGLFSPLEDISGKRG